MNRKPLQRRLYLAIAWLSLAYASTLAGQQARQTDWQGGNGQWADSARWSAGFPTVFQEASIRGSSSVVVPEGKYTAARLNIGTHTGDNATVAVNGGQLLIRQDSLIVGERTGSTGTFILNSGTAESVMDVFIGGATGSTGRMNHSLFDIRGGTFVGLSITIGEGLGSDSTVSIEGSRADAISALEFVMLLAAADPGGKPGQTTLSYTLDSGGVTPIAIQSRWSGLRIQHDSSSHCNLRIALSDIPPREDITLVSSRVPNEGFFDNLPEGSIVSAEYGGETYRWNLTYRGGTSGHDLVLQNRSDYSPGTPVTHVRVFPPPPRPLWWQHPVYALAIHTGRDAFPGAEGYGALTPGGRGGRRISVTNLNDAGPGSLRNAIEGRGPRIVAFRVGGTVLLKSPLTITNPYLTIDGAGAPSPGIMLRRHGIEVHTHDVILRYFRIRIGDEDVHQDDKNVRYAAGDGEYALDFTDGSSNSIADHLSLSWSTNKILSTTGGSDRITIQWCILSESLNLDGHGYASIAGGNRVTWHHNLFAHNYSRNPRFQGAVDADFRNNVLYDWGEKSAYGEFDRLNFVANYLKPGPSAMQKPLLFMDGRESVAPGSLYLSANILETEEKVSQDNWRGTGFYYDRETIMAVEAFPAPPIPVESAAEAYRRVLDQAGATQPSRDAVDTRIISEVRNGTGHIVDSVDQAGGWPKF